MQESQRLPEDEVIALVQQLRATGDKDARDKLIASHMPLAAWVARRYAYHHPNRTEDILSAGFLGLTQAVDWAAVRLKDDHITPYISVTVKRFIRDFIEADSLMPIPRKTFKKMQVKGEQVPFFAPVESCQADEENYIPADITENTPSIVDDRTPDELLAHIIRDDRDQVIVDLLMEEYTMQEIGDELDISKQRVSMLVADIRRRTTQWEERYE